MYDKEPTPCQIRTVLPSTRARMIFDSSLSALPSGTRGTERDRHLLFFAPGLDLHVKITEENRHNEVYGQVIPHEPAEESSTIMLGREGDPKDMRKPDAFGEFSFNNVPGGDVALEIILPSRRIVATFDV